MAPKRAVAKAAQGPAAKKAKGTNSMFAGVIEAIETSDVPEEARNLLLAVIPHAFGGQGDRHTMQTKVIDMVGGIIDQLKAKHQAAVDGASVAAKEASEAQEPLSAAVHDAQEALDKAVQAVEEQKSALAAAAKEVQLLKKALAEAEVGAKAAASVAEAAAPAAAGEGEAPAQAEQPASEPKAEGEDSTVIAEKLRAAQAAQTAAADGYAEALKAKEKAEADVKAAGSALDSAKERLAELERARAEAEEVLSNFETYNVGCFQLLKDPSLQIARQPQALTGGA